MPPIAWKELAEQSPVHRISFGSCSLQYQEQPIWNVIDATKPDLFLHLGDLIYADILPYGARGLPQGMDVVAKARLDYAFLQSHADFVSFVEKTPFLSVWDDHDLGQNDAGRTFPKRREMEELYLEFIGAAADDARRQREGLYHARNLGPAGQRVQVIVLDTRSFRDDLLKDTRSAEEKRKARVIGTYAPHSDPHAQLLGAEQWAWLEEKLKEPADLRLIASSIQVIASEKGIESWGNFPHERKRLYDLIATTHASGVLLLSGDVHFAELSKTDAGPYPLFDLTSSNLAQHESHWGENVINNYRVSGPYSGVNFGQIDVDWNARIIHLSVLDHQGHAVFAYDLPLRELKGNAPQ